MFRYIEYSLTQKWKVIRYFAYNISVYIRVKTDILLTCHKKTGHFCYQPPWKVKNFIATSRLVIFFNVNTTNPLNNEACIAAMKEEYDNKDDWHCNQTYNPLQKAILQFFFGTCRIPVFSAMAASVEQAPQIANEILSFCHMISS